MRSVLESLREIKDDNSEIFRPIIFNLDKNKDVDEIEELIKDGKIKKVVDDISKQKGELNLLENPKFLFEGKKGQKVGLENGGVWIYYPWHFTLVHCLSKNNYNKLRLSRNKELINEKEQKHFGNLRVGFAGLNVGNPIAVCIALEGGSSRMMKLADNDTLDFSNLNRFRANGVCDLGINKAILTARQVCEVNPFTNIEVLPHGIKVETIEDFLTSPQIDILVEEMDNLDLKIKIREAARSRGIPVVMITGNGEDVIIDIERFDRDKNAPLLNGHLKKEVIEGIEKGPKTIQEKVELARDFMGKELLTERLRQSFDLVGKEIVGIPQISEASYLRGAVICNVIRNLNEKNIQSGRYFFKLSNLFK